MQSLTHLYQPLIGPKALMLYQTLVNEAALQADAEPQTHHALMNYMMLPLDEIYQARLKLEAMGLVRTFKKEMEQSTVYTYDLQAPYDPRSFFADAMFSSLLYHYIGEDKYDRLKEMFESDDVSDKGEDITAKFQDVFQTIPTRQAPQVEMPEQDSTDDGGEADFPWLEQMLQQRMIPPKRVLTKENRTLISQMLALYDLESYEIDKALLWSLNEGNELVKDEFKRACHDIFRAKNNNKPIRLIPKTKIEQTQTKSDEPKTKEEELIQLLETISPKQLLEDLSSGNEASEQDLKMINDVMTSQGLPVPVMNVLIHYVLLQTNMKLQRPYVEKIASHWSRAKLKTAREAMEFAKKERANFEKRKNKQKRYPRQSAFTKDIVPDWYKKGKHKEKPNQTGQQATSEEQSKVAKFLKRYTEEN